jgi:hypothetical protein
MSWSREFPGFFSSVRRQRAWISAAAGISVAYVFVDLLPELAAQNRVVVEAGGEALRFAAQRIYVLALLSFVVLYGLQYIVVTPRLYAFHVTGFAAYAALIGYLLDERAARGAAAFAVYAAAMGVHLLIVDHSLAAEHGAKYAYGGRWVLATCLLAGVLAGLLTNVSQLVFARLFAILAGGVVITSLGAELPGGEGRFWPFCLGALLFAALLLFA